jgi:hypothetical protein
MERSAIFLIVAVVFFILATLGVNGRYINTGWAGATFFAAAHWS